MGYMIPYILPLILGRTINLDTLQVGVDIFPKEVVENPVVIHNPTTETVYKVVDSAIESRDLLDVAGSFSLNVKSGIFKAGASGEYLTDKYNRESVVEVAVKATYVTETHQLAADAKPYDLWQQQGKAVGTHFVRSITYGGELIGSIRLEANTTKDKQKIKGSVEVGGRIKIFDLGVEVEGEYFNDVAKSVESSQIKVFSSIPLGTAPNDMKTLKKALDEFPEDLKNFDKGRGIPIKMELWPLSVLDSTKSEKLRNKVLEANLDEFEQKFDDLTNTKQAIFDWMKILTVRLTPEQEEKVGHFYEDLEKTIKPFYQVIGKLDMTKDSEQLKPANEAYGLTNIPGTWYKKYLILRQQIAKDQGAWSRSRGNGVTYIHWGSRECTENSEKMYNGSVLGPSSGYGGGSNFLCMPDKPIFGDQPENKKNASFLIGASYQFPNGKNLVMPCSRCRLAARGSVESFVGRTECPEDWEPVYQGILMSGTHNAISTKFICLDKEVKETEEVKNRNPLRPDWAIVGGPEDEEQILLTCVVCAK